MSQEPIPPLSHLAKSIVVGSLYEHYKGLRYKILAVGRHSESLEEFVVYEALYGDLDIWVRPLSLFTENVIYNEQIRPRFALVV